MAVRDFESRPRAVLERTLTDLLATYSTEHRPFSARETRCPEMAFTLGRWRITRAQGAGRRCGALRRRRLGDLSAPGVGGLRAAEVSQLRQYAVRPTPLVEPRPFDLYYAVLE